MYLSNEVEVIFLHEKELGKYFQTLLILSKY